ncbi:unnamed protein product [Lymnaea stagnalis]|uniref:Serine protease HTRA2, mitochondrial n=1 Tax=Lymnaea stagnalis TaxID=6523 RepID=A0AAV2H909_LYMST
MAPIVREVLSLQPVIFHYWQFCSRSFARRCPVICRSNIISNYNLKTKAENYNDKTNYSFVSHLRDSNVLRIRSSHYKLKELSLLPPNKHTDFIGRSKDILRKFLTLVLCSAGGYLVVDFLKPTFTLHAAPSSLAQRNFIADIVDKAGPAVVFIEIKGRHPVSGKRVTIANGSGFLVRQNGLILTNAHVVANKSKVIVKLHDGSTFEGTVTAVDPVCDLATVKIDTEKKLPIIPLGKSASIRPGEFVAAMGSPLSLHKTVTIGIVSSHLRGSKELGINNNDMEYIQTDATIGLGNSGGPLVNLDGRAIGINTLKLTEGISFAIPSDYALPLLEKADLLAGKADLNKKPNYLPNGKETNKRRYMGITMLPLTVPIIMELKEKFADFPEIATGVYIHRVIVSSPAYAGGLHAGDIIIDINGAKIDSAGDVYSMVEKSDMLRITVIRGKHLERFSVITEAL